MKIKNLVYYWQHTCFLKISIDYADSSTTLKLAFT